MSVWLDSVADAPSISQFTGDNENRAGLGCGQSDQEVGRGAANTHETVKSITEW